jgi:hypothetical protein
MSVPTPKAVAVELPAISLAVALAVALIALGAALVDRVMDPVRSNPSCDAEAKRAYSLPAAATTFSSRFDRAVPSGMGDEHAPLAQRYAADLSRSGKMDSPRGGPPSRLSHHSSSLYVVGTLRAEANIA